jgi:hypothetical protein
LKQIQELTSTAGEFRIQKLVETNPVSCSEDLHFLRTTASLPGHMGVMNGSNIWLHDNTHDCWIHEQNLQDYIQDIPRQLQYCKTPHHLVGGLQPQYSRQDCYDGPSLDAPSRDLGFGDYIDLSCEMFGETVKGNQ